MRQAAAQRQSYDKRDESHLQRVVPASMRFRRVREETTDMRKRRGG